MKYRIVIILALVFMVAGCNGDGDQENNGNGDVPLSTSKILVLDDCDPDYDNPPYDDKLTIMKSDGQVIKEITGFNICQTVGGLRQLAISADGQRFVVCEDVADKNDKLSMYDIQGNLLWTIDGNPHVACFYEDTVYVCGVFPQYPVSGKYVWRFDATGDYLSSGFSQALDIATHPASQTVWAVTSYIRKLAPNLTILGTLNIIEWMAVSVDVNPNGSAWVAEAAHPQVSESKNRLLKISLGCEVVQTIDLDDRLNCVRVNQSTGDIWAAGAFGIIKFDSQGNEIVSVGCGYALTLDIDPYDGSVWVGCLADVRHYSATGEEMGIFTSGFSATEYKFIGVAVAN